MMVNPDAGSQPLKVLVTGAGGQVGTELLPRIVAKGWSPIAAGHRPGDRIDVVVDISNSEAVNELVGRLVPDVVIHAAAMTDVEACEKLPELAHLINHSGARNVAQAARRVGAWMVSISTDFVFSGLEPPYLESSLTQPLSVYGASKLGGEHSVLESDSSNAVVRTAWVYGGQGKHFPRTIMDLLHRNETIDVVNDERGSPTYAADLAEALVDLAALRPSGIFHLVNNGTASRYDMAVRVAMSAGFDHVRIHPTSTERFLQNYPLLAQRPKDSTLVNTRASSLGVSLRSWEAALSSYMPILLEERRSRPGE